MSLKLSNVIMYHDHIQTCLSLIKDGQFTVYSLHSAQYTWHEEYTNTSKYQNTRLKKLKKSPNVFSLTVYCITSRVHTRRCKYALDYSISFVVNYAVQWWYSVKNDLEFAMVFCSYVLLNEGNAHCSVSSWYASDNNDVKCTSMWL